MGGRLVELSHPIRDGLITVPGEPAPSVRRHVNRGESAGAIRGGHSPEVVEIGMVATTGTHLDVPGQDRTGPEDLSDVGLERMADLPGLLINASGHRAIERFHLVGDSLKGRAVLFRTDWSHHFGESAYARGAPYLSAATARALIEGGAALVGIDAPSVDDVEDASGPARAGLLGAGIPIVENLANLGALPAAGFRFTAAPPMVEGMSSFPVRAFALLSA